MTMEFTLKYPIYRRGTVVYCSGPNDYTCRICPEEQKTSLEVHLQDECHIQRLKHYTQYFTDTGPLVLCKLCLRRMDCSRVIEHALSHKLIPWYVSEKSPEILFKNFISQREHEYFCHLCKVKLSSWFLVESHNEDRHHQTLRKDKIDKIIVPESSYTASYYQLAAKNSIFMKSAESLFCYLCDCEVTNSYENILVHVEEKFHMEKQKETIEVFKSAIIHLFRTRPIHQEIPDNSSIEVTSEYKHNSNNRFTSILSICTECNCEIFNEDMDAHVLIHKQEQQLTGGYTNTNNIRYSQREKSSSVERHKIVTKATENVPFADSNNELIVLDKESVDPDLLISTWNNNKDLINMNNPSAEKMTTPASDNFLSSSSTPSSQSKSSSVTNNQSSHPMDNIMSLELPEWIASTGEGTFFECKICQLKINGYKNTFEHAKGTRHLGTLRRQFTVEPVETLQQDLSSGNSKSSGKNHVKFINDFCKNSEPQKLPEGIVTSGSQHFFKCNICHLQIIGHKNTFGHVKGRNHLKNLKERKMFSVVNEKREDIRIEAEMEKEKLNSDGTDSDLDIYHSLTTSPTSFPKFQLVEKIPSTNNNLPLITKSNKYGENTIKKILNQNQSSGRELLDKTATTHSLMNELMSVHPEDRVAVTSSGPTKSENDSKILPQKINNIPCLICNCLIPGDDSHVNIHKSSKKHLENEAKVKAKATKLEGQKAKAPEEFQSEFSLTGIPLENIRELHYLGDIIDSIECKVCYLKIRGTLHTSAVLEYSNHTNTAAHKTKEVAFIDNWKKSGVTSYANKVKQPKRKQSKKKISRVRTHLQKNLQCSTCHEEFEFSEKHHSHMTQHLWQRFLEVDTATQSPEGAINGINEDSSETLRRDATESLVETEDLEFVDERWRESLQTVVESPSEFSTKPLDIAIAGGVNIYEMDRHKIEDINLGVLLSISIDKDRIYCLVCQKSLNNLLQIFYEHLCSVTHLDRLQEMIEDHRKFRDYPDQLSDLALAGEYMEEISGDIVRCHACGISVGNDSVELHHHINDPTHIEKYSSLEAIAKDWFKALYSRMEANFYNTLIYWCVPCEKMYSVESEFQVHLKRKEHKSKIEIFKNAITIFDYCAPCGTLWYGFLHTFHYHSICKIHKYQIMSNGNYVVDKMPYLAERLLRAPERNIEEILIKVETRRIDDSKSENGLIRDLERISKEKYPRVKAYPFGSRISGLAGRNSNFDIFLDCSSIKYQVYPGYNSSLKEISVRLMNIKKCLEKDVVKWHIDRIISNCRVPIIKVTHKPTGIECDISFSNGLTVEKTKMINAYCNNYPECRKLIIFLKNWIGHCDLTGHDGISSYGIAWLVIYFLQVKMILPTVSELIERKKKSKIIAGWETGVTTNFQPRTHDEDFRALLMQFFKFYEAFDYRNYVICPLVGKAVEKKDFQTPTLLPPDMKLYRNYVSKVRDCEPFRIDSIMCLQDPFDLAHNISKDVRKFIVHRFKTFCSLSAPILDNDC
ncbi:uncharacterized protein [Fopius arisanus]|uniref:C2H2-type domain-containing protein n=1 Tax=Fopius arisanus TaxID=64838 RepID=A0A9R1TEI9_9HYME|nr:PREDICTED: uncharacterized protein LOC105269215 [Fopius arisanus]